MTRTARWAGALALALALTACGGDGDEDLATAPQSVPAACPAEGQSAALEAETIEAPEGVTDDLGERPKVPANAGTPATEVQVADVVVGDGAQARPGSAVEVKYVGAVDKTGKEFDASWNGGPEQTIPFTACGQDVVPGFSVSPVGMKVGGRRLVRIPEQYGYPGGNPQAGIAPGDVITFVIDLTKAE